MGSDLVLCWTVRDAALSLDVMAGENPGDPFTIAAPPRSFRMLSEREPGNLRIGFNIRSPVDTPVHSEAVAAVKKAINLLPSLGHEVEEATTDYDGQSLARSYLSMYFAQIAATLNQARELGARAQDVELLTRTLAALGRGQNSAEYVTRHREWNRFGQALGEFHQRYDLYLTPTIAHPFDTSRPNGQWDKPAP